MVIPKIKRKTNIVGGKGVQFYTNKRKFNEKIQTVFAKHRDSIEKYRTITYTNDMVKFYNKLIRDALDLKDLFCVNEILMGYTNSDLVENGQEYIIKKVEYKYQPINYTINYSLVGFVVTMAKDREGETFTIFFPDINKQENSTILNKLKELADKVNKRGSTRQDYANYIRLKSQIYFIENVYNYKGKILNETNLKEQHPRLFDNLGMYVSNRKIRDSKNTESFNIQYPKLLKERLEDDKPIGDTEKICDRFQIIEKDLDYGYSLTVHKAQGSTFYKVFVDETDFKKIRDKWNHNANAMENGIKERNQLLYVALTRPTHVAYVLYDDD
jgi:hypothetical protein